MREADVSRLFLSRIRSHVWGISAVAALGGALAITIALPPRPWLVWNASASTPIGLYRVGSRAAIEPGDTVIAWTPAGARALAARRRYHPANVPLVKTVAGRAGDRICAHGRQIFVSGRSVAIRRTTDSAGRALPWWHGCVTLGPGGLLLISGHPGSFDGRYFGPIASVNIVGEAHPLWTR